MKTPLHPRVELVYFDGCPNVDETRSRLRRALRASGQPEAWTEWRADDPRTPEDRRGFGSPTVLVDGRDVAVEDVEEGAGSDGGASCRVYPGGDGSLSGSPTAEVIRGALESRGVPATDSSPDGSRGAWLGLGVVAAALSSACCWLPWAFATLGAGVVGAAGFFETARPVLLLVAFGSLGTGLVLRVRARRRWAAAACCAPARSRPSRRVAFWAVVLLVPMLAALPLALPELVGQADAEPVGSADTEARTFAIAGMTCESCARLLEGALRDLPGVTAAEVSYADGRARITAERGGLPSDVVILETVETSGFAGEPVDE